MIHHYNVPLVKYEGHKKAPAKAVKTLQGTELHGLPVVLRVGAVDYKLGMIHQVRKGRDEMFGDIILEIEGHLEFEPVQGEGGKITGVKPIKFVYLKE